MIIFLNNIDLSKLAETKDEDIITRIISNKFWDWYNIHKNDKVITIFFKLKTIYVKDIKGIFVILFGPDSRPVTITGGESVIVENK